VTYLPSRQSVTSRLPQVAFTAQPRGAFTLHFPHVVVKVAGVAG